MYTCIIVAHGDRRLVYLKGIVIPVVSTSPNEGIGVTAPGRAGTPGTPGVRGPPGATKMSGFTLVWQPDSR